MIKSKLKKKLERETFKRKDEIINYRVGCIAIHTFHEGEYVVHHDFCFLKW